MKKISKMLVLTTLMCWIIYLSIDAVVIAKNPQEKEDNRNPLGCYEAGYQFDLKTLHLYPWHDGAKQSMYFMFNTRKEALILYQMRDADSAHSMYLNHAINPHQWAVFATTENQVKFICTIADAKASNYGKIVDCAKSLRVCEYTNVRFGLNNRGNYWIVRSNTRGGALSEVIHYGIIPAI